MSKWKRLLLSLPLVTCCLACVEEIQLGDPADFSEELVVEGSVNDFDESFRVRLSTTTDTRGLGQNFLGTGASVKVISENDTVYFREIKPGIYDSDSGALHIETGLSYLLDIVIADERHYQSTWVSLPAVIPVITSSAVAVNTSRIDEFGVFRRSWAHAIFVELENAAVPQYYKFDMTGWREKYVAYLSTLVRAPTRCWAYEDPATRGVKVGNNAGLAQGTYLANAGSIRATGKERYLAEVKVSTLSEDAYRYWLAARTQLEREKGVFVAPFATVLGNIRNVNDENEVVHGYFHAYAQQLTRTCFDSFDLPLGNPINTIGIACADFFAPAEYVLPDEDELCD